VSDRPALGLASLAAGAVATVTLYVTAFLPGAVHNLGWDAAGYVVQMRAASSGLLDLPGTRPGVGVTGAFVSGLGLTPVGVAPIVLAIAVAVCLGAASAAALRLVTGSPAWGLGAVALVVAAWGGTARMTSGYLATLLSLAVFVAATTLAFVPGAGWLAIATVSAAALLAHPGLLPAFAAILVGWWLVTLRADDHRPGATRPIAVVGAFSLVSVIAVAIVGGLLGVGIEDLQDLAIVRERFDERAADILSWIDPALTLAMIAAGVVLLLARRDGRPPTSAVWLGIVWLAVSAGGLLVLALFPPIPGHRTLLLGVPAPMLGGLAVVTVAGSLRERGSERFRTVSVGAVSLALAAAVGIVSLRPLEERARRPADGIGTAPHVIAGYLSTVDAEGPVVIVMDPPERLDLLAWKARQNAVRSLAPDPVFLRIVTYVGDERRLLMGLPTRRGEPTFDAVVDRTWPAVREVIGQGPIVVVPREWVAPETWDRVAGSAGSVSDEVAVLRGPAPPGAIPTVEAPELPAAAAGLRISLLVLVLGAAGGGWSWVVLRRRADLAATVGLAPALGLVVVVLAGTGVALAGLDPGGPVGIAAVAVAGTVGWILTRRPRDDRAA
jgi:hypothetical protein